MMCKLAAPIVVDGIAVATGMNDGELGLARAVHAGLDAAILVEPGHPNRDSRPRAAVREPAPVAVRAPSLAGVPDSLRSAQTDLEDTVGPSMEWARHYLDRPGGPIVIDLPETGLHPRWQVEYAQFLVDLHMAVGCPVFAVTHSPYMWHAFRILSEQAGIRARFYAPGPGGFGEVDREGFDNVVEEMMIPFDVLAAIDEQAGRAAAAQRCPESELPVFYQDEDWRVREIAADRCPEEDLPVFYDDEEAVVRLNAAWRCPEADLHLFYDDPDKFVRRAAAKRCPQSDLPRFYRDKAWCVRLAAVGRCPEGNLPLFHDDEARAVRETAAARTKPASPQR